MTSPCTAAARALAAALGMAALAAPGAGQAHHSFAMFDATRTVTLKGTVKEFQWTNPHVLVWVVVPSASGSDEEWSLELTSPGNLTRLGWTRTSLKPGDQVTVSFNPLRDGQHGGGLKQVMMTQTGQIIGMSGRSG